MILNTEGTKPIYVQIAEWLETEILNQNIKPDEKVYSQYQLADMFNINPATAAKGLNILADQHLVYKRRGLGMFVVAEARQFILEKRKSQRLSGLVLELVREAAHLSVAEEELLLMIKQAQQEVEQVKATEQAIEESKEEK